MFRKVIFVFILLLVDYIIRNSKPKIYYRDNIIFGYNAVTIPLFGIFISSKEKDNLNLLNHELVHWQQYRRMGFILFYFRYFFEMIYYGYDASPMEIEARYIENDFCKLNYSHCVRNGLSNTVRNKDFRA
ncbi:hypothetical protein [Capnocytophaga canimorsus]|uniref:hypothetical protein n=1 Tax=Capnocytophaga canimorsus TaxID=28188 RepID=UPI0028EFB82C|nr:hypothetical protein [Capnocytophaga canimorsus]MDT9500409.1 hypothetical protein [Capnocytophaga canimorsus]